MNKLFTAYTTSTEQEESKKVVGYYLFSNIDQKHLIMDKDSTPMTDDENDERTWQKFYEIQIDTLEVYNES